MRSDFLGQSNDKRDKNIYEFFWVQNEEDEGKNSKMFHLMVANNSKYEFKCWVYQQKI